jgi:DNA (cytosine-5)-methyltransferase 1
MALLRELDCNRLIGQHQTVSPCLRTWLATPLTVTCGFRMPSPWSALELFCGIGGFSAALEDQQSIEPTAIGCGRLTAVDIDETALAVHQLNFPQHRRIAAELRTFDAQGVGADFWWLSPPCLPFTRKGRQLDDNDRRTESIFRLIAQIKRDHPKPLALAIENVPPFAESRTAAWVTEHLHQAGFETAWELRCPTELGWPMRRKRAYLLASRNGLRPLSPAALQHRPLGEFLNHPQAAEMTCVRQDWLEQYSQAIDLIDPGQSDCQASCFTSSYGRSPVRSGSYLKLDHGARFFSPQEILRLLGFSDRFVLPETIALNRRWALAGNSLSLPVVRWVLSRIDI